jgi:hypothetical protein
LTSVLLIPTGTSTGLIVSLTSTGGAAFTSYLTSFSSFTVALTVSVDAVSF